MIDSDLFYCENGVIYPPFKKGRYLEEYFLEKMKTNNLETKRKYIPALWTNFQIKPWFSHRKQEMQTKLNEWINKNPSEKGYFTIVQYDDACLLNLPENTVVYGSCSGDKPLPLIYEDTENKLETFQRKSFQEKKILCSFVGTITSNNVQPNVRKVMINYLRRNKDFKFLLTNGWTDNVNKKIFQQIFQQKSTAR